MRCLAYACIAACKVVVCSNVRAEVLECSVVRSYRFLRRLRACDSCLYYVTFFTILRYDDIELVALSQGFLCGARVRGDEAAFPDGDDRSGQGRDGRGHAAHAGTGSTDASNQPRYESVRHSTARIVGLKLSFKKG